jgi:hypothetical protein
LTHVALLDRQFEGLRELLCFRLLKEVLGYLHCDHGGMLGFDPPN